MKTLRDIPVVYICPAHNEKYLKRKVHMDLLLKNLGFKNVTMFKSGTEAYPTCLVQATIDVLTSRLDDEPFILLEDDVDVTEWWDLNKPLIFPQDTDAMYLGFSKCGGSATLNLNDGPSQVSRISNTHIKIHNMLGAHAILYVSRRYKQAVLDEMYEILDKVGHLNDVALSRIQSKYNIYGYHYPMFYQSAAFDGPEDITKFRYNFETHTPNDKDIIFVSALKDIGRGEWKTAFPRSTDAYIADFYSAYENLDKTFKLVVFVEEPVRHKLEKLNLPTNIELRDYTEVENTFFDKYIESHKAIIHSDEYQNKIPWHRKHLPEHIYAEYNLANHNKVNFVSKVKKLYPDFQFYSWIDFGMTDPKTSPTPEIEYTSLSHKIHYSQGLDIVYHDPDTLLCLNEIYIRGGQFIVHRSLVDEFESVYDNMLEYLTSKNITDDDQAIVFQLYHKYPHMFQLHKHPADRALFITLATTHPLTQTPFGEQCALPPAPEPTT